MTTSIPSTGGKAGAFRSRPAVAIALLIAGGVALRDVLNCRPGVWIGCILVLLGVGAILHRRSRWADLALAIAVVLVGLLAAQIDYYRYPADHIWTYTREGERFAQLELAIVESPRLVPAAPGDPRMLEPKQTVRAEIRQVRTLDGWRAASGTISLTLEQLNPNLAAGQIVRATGMLERPSGPMNPGEFDYYGWEREQRVLATFYVSHADGVKILWDSGPGVVVWLREKARHLLAAGFTLDRGYDHALLRAFVLGDSDPQLEDLEEQFVNTGVVHCMSISGLHVAIAGGFVLFLGRLLRASPRGSLIAALIVVTLYGVVATPTWPGWRSILMFGAFGAGLMSRRWPDSIQLFAAAVGAILLVHPGDISNGGFQISFAAVLGMMLFTPRLMRWSWTKWRGPDGIALRPTRRNAAVNAGLWVGRFFISALFASAIAWLMVIPLIAYHYGQLNTYSGLAGVVFLPVTVVALLFGLGKIVLTLCWPSAAHFFAIVCSIPVIWLREMAAWLAKVPGATIPLPTPSVWLLVIYYGLFLLALFRLEGKVARRVRRWAAGEAVGAGGGGGIAGGVAAVCGGVACRESAGSDYVAERGGWTMRGDSDAG